MKQEVKIGQTDYTVEILIRDTNGAPKTGLTYESAGLDFCYTRVETDNDVVLTDGAPVVTTLAGAHVDWGFVKVDDTKAPGAYKLDLPDGVFASGAWSAVVHIVCTGCDPTHIEFVFVPESPYNGVDVKSVAGTAQTANDNGADINTILADLIDGGRLDLLIDAIKAVTDNLPDAGALTTIGTDTARLTAARAGALTDWIDGGRLDLLLDAIKAVTDVESGVKAAVNALNNPTTAAIADAVWDELLTGAIHNIATSAGRRLRQAADVLIVREETCQAGGGNDEVILDAAASAVDDFYNNDIIILISGAGAGQSRHIDDYDGGTVTATVNRDWTTNPDATTGYVIRFDSTKHVHGFSIAAKAEINAEADGAFATWAPPTKVEMDAAHALLATVAKQDIIDTVVDAIKAVTDLLPNAGALNDLAAIKAVTDVESGVKALVAALNNLSAAQVNDEVVDALNVDTYAEPPQEAPGDTISIARKISYCYKFLRNLITNDGTDIEVYNSAGAVVDHKAPVSAVAGTVTRGKFISGP